MIGMDFTLTFARSARWPVEPIERVGRRGFTLIEIMLAIAIFAGVMIAIYSSWSAVLRASRTGLDAAASAQRARVALRAVEESLASVQFFTENAPYYSFLADTSGEFASLSYVARLSASFPGSGLFPGQPVRRVTFSVESDEEGDPALVLRQSPILEPVDSAEDAYEIRLAPDVTRLQVEFLDLRTGEWLTEWLATNDLPRLVRFSLGFGLDRRTRKPQDVYQRVVSIVATPIPRAFQAPSVLGAGLVQPGGRGGSRATPNAP